MLAQSFDARLLVTAATRDALSDAPGYALRATPPVEALPGRQPVVVYEVRQRCSEAQLPAPAR
jgi:class 3 adenylate cyclase